MQPQALLTLQDAKAGCERIEAIQESQTMLDSLTRIKDIPCSRLRQAHCHRGTVNIMSKISHSLKDVFVATFKL